MILFQSIIPWHHIVKLDCISPCSFTVSQVPGLSSCPFHHFWSSSSNVLSPLPLLITSIVSRAPGLTPSPAFPSLGGRGHSHHPHSVLMRWVTPGRDGLSGACFLHKETLQSFHLFLLFSLRICSGPTTAQGLRDATLSRS